MLKILIRTYILTLFMLLVYPFSQELRAQDKFWVYFKDKKGVDFNPFQYFDVKAIERRKLTGISLYDSTDYPISPKYIQEVEKISGNILAGLRWFNAVLVSIDSEDIKKVRQLPFVARTERLMTNNFIMANYHDTVLNADDIRILEFQTQRMQGGLFQKKGYTGKGIRIAIFDAGFPGVNKLPAFVHLIQNKQIKETWDFARKKADVFLSNPHGTMVLSCLAGIIDGKEMGLAVDAEFLLARTEVEREVYMEEVYWLQAMEWADKNGASIINSSLAYTYERYNTFEMNGSTSLVSKAASLAAHKGILVVNAMGNDGNSDWKILATPADADSVLSVGAISPTTDFHAGFSSFGPTSKFKMKPNVVAPGKVIVSGKTKLEKVEGTSFSSPLVAGFAACAWQSMPYLTNMQLFGKIEQSGHLYPYFDYAHGYGVPQASFFVDVPKVTEKEATFEFKLAGDLLYIEVNPKFIDKKFMTSNNYLYYHVENQDNYLEHYWLVDVFTKHAAVINLKDYPKGKVVRAHYKGFINEFHFN
jgi:serine protease AprX